MNKNAVSDLNTTPPGIITWTWESFKNFLIRIIVVTYLKNYLVCDKYIASQHRLKGLV